MSNKIETINPATGKVIATYDNISSEEVSQKVKKAKAAFEKWGKLEISERTAYMRSLGRIMRKNKDEYA